MKKSVSETQKLRLRKEYVRSLTLPRLEVVVGGITPGPNSRETGNAPTTCD